MSQRLPEVPTTTRIYTRADLLALGWSSHRIAGEVRAGRLLRPRRGSYLEPTAPTAVVEAVAAGGRLACLSALAQFGVFVRMIDAVHVHFAKSRSRLPHAVRQRRHWRPLVRSMHPRSACVDVFDALIQAIDCQSPRDAVASVDSALHLGLLRHDELAELFSHVSWRKRRLRHLVDGRAESGCETLVRLMLRGMGARYDLQVVFAGIGRVDILVDGWLVIECDSRAHHSDWESQRRDRRRDQELAARGYVVYRPIAEDILFHPERVIAAIRGLRARLHRASA